MMKKIYIILLTLIITFISNIAVIDAKKCTDKNILIKCVYKSNHNKDNLKNISLTINKSNPTKVNNSDLGATTYVGSAYSSGQVKNENLVNSGDFVDVNGKYKCPSVYITKKSKKVGTFPSDQNVVYYSLVVKKQNDSDVSTTLDSSNSCKSSTSTKAAKSTKDEKKCFYENGAYIIVNTKKKTVDSNLLTISYNEILSDSCPLFVCSTPNITGIQYGTPQVSGTKYFISNNPNELNNGNPMRTCYSGIMHGTKYKCLFLASNMMYVTKKAYKSTDPTILKEYKEKRSYVLTYCDEVFNQYNYAEGGIQKICIDECLNIREDIVNMEKQTGKKNNQCKLSDKIVALVYNVLKWMKYIAPVLVIVLGILDFIKALAASDDDAMKKAQGKFIKRLIAAALLFLLPLIIDYVLRIFGMVNSECNITKIF